MEQGKHEDTGNKSGKSQEEAFSSGFKKDEKTEQGSTRPEHSVLHNGLNRKGTNSIYEYPLCFMYRSTS